MNDELLFRAATSRTTRQEEMRLRPWLAASADNEQRRREVVDVLLLTMEAENHLRFELALNRKESHSIARKGEEAVRPSI